MDGEGKYLLTEEGTMIKLNQEQIEALFDSKVVEIIEPWAYADFVILLCIVMWLFSNPAKRVKK